MTAEVFEAVQSNIKQCQEANDVVENTEKSVDAVTPHTAIIYQFSIDTAVGNT